MRQKKNAGDGVMMLLVDLPSSECPKLGDQAGWETEWYGG